MLTDDINDLIKYSHDTLRHTNTLMPFELDVSLSMMDISRLTHGLYTPDHQKKTFPATICSVKETGATLNLFSTGKIVVGGLNSDFHTILSTELFRYTLNAHYPQGGRIIRLKSNDKTNDVYAFQTKHTIDVKSYYKHNKHNTKITGKFNNISTKIGKDGEDTSFTLIIFATGKINVIGVRRHCVNIKEVVANTIRMLYPYFIH